MHVETSARSRIVRHDEPVFSNIGTHVEVARRIEHESNMRRRIRTGAIAARSRVESLFRSRAEWRATAFVRILTLVLPLIAAATGSAQTEDRPKPPTEPSDGLEQAIDAVGLFRGYIDVDELDASGEMLQNPVVTDMEDSNGPVEDDEAQGGEGVPPRFEPFVAPMPFRSPSLGWGGALTVGTLFRIDPDDRGSPPSTAAVAGFGSENESFGGVFVFRGHAFEDLFRPRFTFASGRANYEFFGIGSDAGSRGLSADLRTEFLIVKTIALLRLPTAGWGRLGENVYLGPLIDVRLNDHSVRRVPGLPLGTPLPSFDEKDLGLGFLIERDKRNNTFRPSAGTLFQLEARFFAEDLGGDEDYQTYDVSLASYHEIPFDTVLAWRGLSRFGSGDVPFNELGQHDLRGYERGRYRDEIHLAGEVELRRSIYKRLGAAVFTGLGQVGPSLDDLESDDLLWSAGFGLRFQLTRESPLNYRSDLAWGRDGFEFYFSLGEEF